MLKKIIAVSAMFALFACSGTDNDDPEPQSSSGGDVGEISSSSLDNGELASSSSLDNAELSSSSSEGPTGPQIFEVSIATFNNLPSELFKSYNSAGPYPYAFTLKDSKNEDLTQFWEVSDPDCPTTSQTAVPPEKCRLLELQATDAILQNTITNQHSALHYDAVLKNAVGTAANARAAVQLKEYSVKAAGDQAALGLNVGDGSNEGKTIKQLSITELDGITQFIYLRKGGAHTFRAAKNDEDFWQYEVPATTDTAAIVIPVDELEGMGSFAAEGTTFDVSEISKFLWVVEYDAKTPAKNEGSVMVLRFRAQVIKE
ncbi:MAG: hypothetical protein FWC26_09440 [Fibromonadales bacterium]|nr:hypothetical protein [Fibromonadales bacterium]